MRGRQDLRTTARRDYRSCACLIKLVKLVAEVGPLTTLCLRTLNVLLAASFILGLSFPRPAQASINPQQSRKQQQHLLQLKIQQQQQLQRQLQHHRQLRLHQHRQVDKYLNQRQQQFRQRLKQQQQNRDWERRRSLQ